MLGKELIKIQNKSAKYIYVTGRLSDSVHIIDVTNPSSMMQVGSINSSTYLNNVTGLAYDSESESLVVMSEANFYLSVLDVSNPTNINRESSGDLGSTYRGVYDIKLDTTNKIAYCSSNTTDRVFSVNYINPSSSYVVSNFTGSSNNMRQMAIDLGTNRLYATSAGHDRIWVLNITSGGSISSVDYQTGGDVCSAIALDKINNKVYSASGGTSDYVKAMTHSDSLPNLGTLTDSTHFDSSYWVDIDTTNNVLYVTSESYDGVSAVDVSNPSSMSRLHSLSLGGGVKSCLLDEEAQVLYVVKANNGEVVSIDVSTPSSMAILHTYNIPSCSGSSNIVCSFK